MSFSYPPHLTILAWVFSDFFFWLTTKCPHAVPKCEQLSYQYIWPTLATYNKGCEWCEVKKTNFPTRDPWTVFRPIIADGKPSCPWLLTLIHISLAKHLRVKLVPAPMTVYPIAFSAYNIGDGKQSTQVSHSAVSRCDENQSTDGSGSWNRRIYGICNAIR